MKFPFFPLRTQKSITSDEEVEEDDEDQNGVNFTMMKQKGVSFYSSGLSLMWTLSLFFSKSQNLFNISYICISVCQKPDYT